jgi:hypothetical protein
LRRAAPTPHAWRQPIAACFAARRGSRKIPLLLQAVLNSIQTVSQTVLLARQSAKRVFGRIGTRALTGALGFGGDLTLCVRQLPCFELQIAECAAPAIRRRRLQLTLEIAKFFQSLCGIRTCLVRLLSAELVGRVAHRL